MGSLSVSSCRCCMFVSCVHPVAVLNAAFCMTYIYIYILSVYSPFSDRVGLPFHNTLYRGVNEEYWSCVFRPDALPNVNHMRGMQYVLCI